MSKKGKKKSGNKKVEDDDDFFEEKENEDKKETSAPKSPSRIPNIIMFIQSLSILILISFIIKYILPNEDLKLTNRTTQSSIESKTKEVQNESKETIQPPQQQLQQIIPPSNREIIGSSPEEDELTSFKNILYKRFTEEYNKDSNMNQQEIYLFHGNQTYCPNHPRTVFFLNKFHTSIPKELTYDRRNPNKMYVEKYIIKNKNYFVFFSTNVDYFPGIPGSFKSINSKSVRNDLYANMVLRRRDISDYEDFEYSKKLTKYQMWYYFPFCNYILLKQSLYRHYFTLREKFGEKDFDYMPETYIFPDQRSEFYKKYGKTKIDSDNMWLFKPKISTRAIGVHLITNFNNIENGIVTRYVSNPHLIDKKKYHLRIYIFVHGFSPLKIYIDREGIFRACSEDYNTNPEDFENRYVHITNSDVNKVNPKYTSYEDYEAKIGGIWRYNDLVEKYKKYGADFNDIWEKLKDQLIKAFISVSDDVTKKIEESEVKFNHGNFFKIYGADVMIDDNFKPWLLEMNSFPDLYAKIPIIEEVNTDLFTDIFNIMGMQLYDHFNPTKSMEKQVYEVDNPENAALESICEFTRPTGKFERVFPLGDNIDKYSRFLEHPGEYNLALWKKMKEIRMQ